MKGGVILGVGMQGCVVSPKLNRNGNTAVRSTKRNSHKKVSKIFFDGHAYQREYKITNRVYEITNGMGSVSLDNDDDEPIYSVTKLNQNTYTNLDTSTFRESACRKVKQALNDGRHIYVINQPKIIGDIRNLAKNPKPLQFYEDAYGALLLLKKHHIRHRDIYPRNIFYDRTGALIGDFGHAVDLDDPTNDLTHYNKNVFNTKDDLIDFVEAIRKYVQLTDIEINTLIQKIKENNFLYFYELAGIPEDQIPQRVLDYIHENPTDDIYIPERVKSSGGSRQRKTRKLRTRTYRRKRT